MPAGDSLHRIAQLLHPKLAGQRLAGLQLVRTIEMRRQGEQQRSTYFCPRCRPRRGEP